MIYANLLHLSYNMWADREVPEWDLKYISSEPYLRFDERLWNDMLQKMVEAGMNMVVIDLGDGVKYDSHPEIAVKNAWSVDKLKNELTKIRKMGLEPIPKLNFSTCHDTWLGDYSRMVSTPKYYDVCKNLIKEVIEIFETPRFFHLGMDEEIYQHQKHYRYVVIRQFDLWWNDLYFYFNQVEKNGVRPWIWSDYLWDHADTFFKKMPKSAVQSNWHYGLEFDGSKNPTKAYLDLDAHGYDQIPTGSNWTYSENFGKTVHYCKQNLDSERLLGFCQTIWKPTVEECRERHEQGIDLVKEVID